MFPKDCIELLDGEGQISYLDFVDCDPDHYPAIRKTELKKEETTKFRTFRNNIAMKTDKVK